MVHLKYIRIKALNWKWRQGKLFGWSIRVLFIILSIYLYIGMFDVCICGCIYNPRDWEGRFSSLQVAISNKHCPSIMYVCLCLWMCMKGWKTTRGSLTINSALKQIYHQRHTFYAWNNKRKSYNERKIKKKWNIKKKSYEYVYFIFRIYYWN